jgi:hypothetical protein
MHEIRQSLLIGICLSSLSSAQNPDRAAELVQREFVLRQLEGGRQAGQTAEERQRAQALETQLRERMNHIATLWKDLVEEFTNKNAFNVHTARELSKAFRELERTECWPKPDREK